MRFLIPCLFSCFIAHGQLIPILLQVKKDTIIRWNYHFGDEFEGNNIDLDKWFDRYPWGGLSVKPRIYAAPEMVSQKDGILHLGINKTNEWRKFDDWMLNLEIAKKNGVEIKDGAMQLNYLTSCIWSKKEFKYGYFECRCKAPSGKGLWPAFWLYGQNQQDEIDFAELKGEKNNAVHLDVHCPDNCDKTAGGLLGMKKNWGGWVKMEEPVTDDWVIFSGVWLPNSLTYFVNGVPVSHFDGNFSTAMNVIANLSVAQDNAPFEPGPDEKTKFPNEFLVDYIRVWKMNSESNNFENQNWTINGNERTNSATLSTTKIRRKIRHIYDKKRLKNEGGFISLLPLNKSTFEVQLNGIERNQVVIQLQNEKGNQIPIMLPSNNIMDLSFLIPGRYTLEIKVGASLIRSEIKI